jgi:hypothetical protein
MENEKRLIEEVLWEAYFERDIKNLFFSNLPSVKAHTIEMAKFKTLLNNHNVEWEMQRLFKANVEDFNNISTEDFIKSYNVRQILEWKKVGNKTLLKLVEIFDKEGFSLRY